MSRVAIFGSSELARICQSSLVEDDMPGEIVVTIDDEWIDDIVWAGARAVPWSKLAPAVGAGENTPDSVLVAIGYTQHNALRQSIAGRISDAGIRLASFVSEECIVSTSAAIGLGSIILAGACVQAFADVQAGVVIWPGAVVSHDAVVGPYAYVSPGAVICGNATIGERSFIGANATVRDGVTIGIGCIVGAGAYVDRDLPDGSVIVPARSVVLDRSAESFAI